jgi:carboxypeptidase Q
MVTLSTMAPSWRSLLLVVAAVLVSTALAGSLPGTYGPIVDRILKAETEQGRAYAILGELTDRVGARLSGSPGAEAAVRWARQRLEADGLKAWTEPVMVPRWVRGVETAEIVTPGRQPLVVTALGGSVPTPDEGLLAEVVEATSFDALRAMSESAVRGRIVLWNRAMVAGDPMQGYRALQPLRTRGAAEAARRGAVASLVRSIGTLTARLPHTGAVDYEDNVPRIPTAAVTAEDAELIHRLLAAGQKVTLRLRLGCRTLPDVESANVVADLKGTERPEEIVLIGAHLDSWDLGTGALDDGAGVAMVMESLRLLRSLGLVPRRTIRGVLYMNEENGGRGGRAYAEAHRDELSRHMAAIETDTGADRPLGFSLSAGSGGLERLGEVAALLKPLGADSVTSGGGGADVQPLRAGGVPLLGLRQDTTHYFDWHHSPGDTLDKVSPADLAKNAAALAIMAYVLADLPEPLPRSTGDATGGGRR